MRQENRGARGGTGIALSLMLAVVLLSACSSADDFFGGRPAPSAGASNASFTQRFRNLFSGGSEPPASQAMAGPERPQDIDCPRLEIRQGASTLILNASSAEQSAMGLRYQATFGRMARECSAAAGQLTIKVGVQGRVILGPAGGPGETTLPLRYALVREGVEPKTIWSKLYVVPVTIPPGQPHVLFTHVEEDLTVPLPPPAELESYVVYVGFDPQGVAQEKKAKPGASARRRP